MEIIMKINYISIKSPMTPVNQDHVKSFLSDIETAGNFRLEQCNLVSYSTADFCVIYIMTGGTEGIFL